MNGRRSLVLNVIMAPADSGRSPRHRHPYITRKADCSTRGMSEITKKSDEQKDAEADVESFRKDLGPFVVAAETTRMAMLFTDATEPDNPIILANDSFLSLTGYDREEVLGKSLNFSDGKRFGCPGADAN
jgi:PAS domain-containing protein